LSAELSKVTYDQVFNEISKSNKKSDSPSPTRSKSGKVIPGHVNKKPIDDTLQ